MNQNKILLRSIAILLTGIATILVFTLAPETYSLFNRYYDGPDGEVIAASTRDIISDIDVYYEGNKPILRLKKAKGLNYSPVVFFSVEGDIEDYVLHVNSIKLEDETDIPIIPNINLSQAVSLIFSREDEVIGEIRVKHLNEFIDEPIEVKLSKRYLLDMYFSDKSLQNYGVDYLSSKEKDGLVEFIKDSITFTNRYLEWDSAEWKEYENQITDSNYYSLPISRADISYHQTSIINIVAPNLLEYNDKLYSILEILVAEFNEEIEKSIRLILEKEELLRKVKLLEEENSKLNSRVIQLEKENYQLSIQPTPQPTPVPTIEPELAPAPEPMPELEPIPISIPEPIIEVDLEVEQEIQPESESISELKENETLGPAMRE